MIKMCYIWSHGKSHPLFRLSKFQRIKLKPFQKWVSVNGSSLESVHTKTLECVQVKCFLWPRSEALKSSLRP